MQAAPNLGFLTVIQEEGGYSGGYLVTTVWGRPLEFRLSTLVQPNRIQQILYGHTLKRYVCAELIGKTLVEKATVPAHFIITDCEPVLDLRIWRSTPMAWLAPVRAGSVSDDAREETVAYASGSDASRLVCHSQFQADAVTIRTLLQRSDVIPDLAEPFARIREALYEARKMGATSRAA